MSTGSSDDGELRRMLRALRIHREFLSNGDDPQAVLDRHPDLTDLLAPLLAASLDAHDPALSARRLGDFQVGPEIARGGMGVVYAATQISLLRPVALKVLNPGLVLDDRSKARFVREARLAAALDHPGITRVIAADATDAIAWFAMELVDGLSLDHVLQALQNAGPQACTGEGFAQVFADLLPPSPARPITPHDDGSHPLTPVWSRDYVETCLRIGAQVADALQHAHDHGVVHRDVKPANVMLRRNGTIALTDFGLARETDGAALTVTGDYLGTPYYSAPEQVRGEHDSIDARADVFALGVMLYELLTLRRPFEAGTAAEVRRSILVDEPTSPRRIHRRVSSEAAVVVLRALEKDPDRRYPTARAFAEDLERLRTGRPVTARPIRAWVRLWRWQRRNPLAASFIAVLLVALLSVALLARRLQERSLDEALATGRLLTQAGDPDGESRLWRAHRARGDAATRWALIEHYRRFACKHVLGDPSDPLTTFAVSGDGHRFATATRSGRIQLWDTDPLRGPIEAVRSDHGISALALSGNGATVAARSPDGRWQVLDWSSSKARLSWADTDQPRSLALDATGARAVTILEQPSGTDELQVWSVDERRLLNRIPLAEPVRGLHLLNDHEALVQISGGALCLLELAADPAQVPPLEICVGVRSFEPVYGSDLVATCTHTGVRLLERIDDHWSPRDLGGPPRQLLAARADGTLVVPSPGTLHTLHPSGGPRWRRQSWKATSQSVALSRAGALVLGDSGELRIWDVDLEEPRSLALGVGTQHGLVFLDDSRLLSGGVGSNLGRTGQPPMKLTASTHLLVADDQEHWLPRWHHGDHGPGFIADLAKHPRGEWTVTSRIDAGRSGEVRIWAARADGPLEAGTKLSSRVVRSLRFSASGARLVGALEDRYGALVWSAPFGSSPAREVYAQGGARTAAAVFLGEDRIVLAGAQLTTWSLDARDQLAAEFAPLPSRTKLHSLASRSDADGWTLAAGDNHGVVRVWHHDTPRDRPTVIAEHDARVFALAFVEIEGRQLVASGDEGGRILLSDPSLGRSLCELQGPSDADGGVFDLAVSPDGRLLAAAGEPDTVRIFRLHYALDFVEGNRALADLLPLRIGAPSAESR